MFIGYEDFLVGEGDQVSVCAYGHSTATEVAAPDTKKKICILGEKSLNC